MGWDEGVTALCQCRRGNLVLRVVIAVGIGNHLGVCPGVGTSSWLVVTLMFDSEVTTTTTTATAGEWGDRSPLYLY
jgi:hypothetical protein